MKAKSVHMKLFLTMFSLSAVTFGGGYVIVPLIKKQVVEKHQWMSEDEVLEYVAIGQSSPGAIAVNTAVLVGYRMAGFSGAICGLMGTIIPPLITLSIACVFYQLLRDNQYVNAAMKGMQAGIAAVIADVVFGMARPFLKKDKLPSLVIMALAFAAVWVFNVNVAVIIVLCGALGALFAFAGKKGDAV